MRNMVYYIISTSISTTLRSSMWL